MSVDEGGPVDLDRAAADGPAPAAFDPARGLRALAAFAGFGISVSALYATTGFGFGCPLRMLTGWECPLCGGTRLGADLLTGDMVGAFGHNPAVFLLLVALTMLGIGWLVEVAGGPKLRPPRAVGQRLARVHPTRWLMITLVLATGYTVARNLL